MLQANKVEQLSARELISIAYANIPSQFFKLKYWAQGTKWDQELNDEVRSLFEEGASLARIMLFTGRSPRSIEWKLESLGLSLTEEQEHELNELYRDAIQQAEQFEADQSID